jgi:DNA-binding HxlR family transcriptional regulator
LARGIVEQIPAEDGTKRMAYRLTKKGKALGPVLKAMRDWGLAWDKSTRVRIPRTS